MAQPTESIDCAARLKILAVEVRLSVVRWLMEHSEGTVTEIGAAVKVEQSLLSHHLKILREHGLVERKIEGQARVYHLTETAAGSLREGKLNLGCCSIDFDN